MRMEILGWFTSSPNINIKHMNLVYFDTFYTKNISRIVVFDLFAINKKQMADRYQQIII